MTLPGLPVEALEIVDQRDGPVRGDECSAYLRYFAEAPAGWGACCGQQFGRLISHCFGASSER